MIGLQRGTVQLHKHHEAWRTLFEQEKHTLTAIFTNQILRIEHIGSTAISGIVAKPIIDMLAVVDSIDESYIVPFHEPLADLGYTFRPLPVHDHRRLFVKGPESCRTHHLSFVTKGEVLNNALFFRDYLRSRKAARQAYQALKKTLGVKYALDRKQYTAGKADFVASILARRDKSLRG